jgi:formamidopyrimidine-DNA glycosylase
MPELPEVETTCRGIAPHIRGKKIRDVVVRNRNLRWPVPVRLKSLLTHQTIKNVQRRGKYILLTTDRGTVIMHLGMSGSLRIVDDKAAVRKHDHVDFVFDHGKILRLHDPRRFGAVLWTDKNPAEHELLNELGPEPLTDAFTAQYLHEAMRGRSAAIKSVIMNSHVVVGVGNIYASEALFLAGIHPARAANRISLLRCERLVSAIKQVLAAAIAQGGTTLRDFVRENGEPGYFAQTLNVYGRAGEPCSVCGKPVSHKVIQQRATYFCSHCQT